MTYQNAFISVYDKKGLYEFLKPLVKEGLRIVSTGGTAKYLKSKELPVVEITEQTQFPEVFSGRVKSLHPLIYMPLLARKWIKEDQTVLKQHKLLPFDLVICNLYPFQEKKHLKNDKELTEWIDVGGPSLLRAAAKNFFSITVICSPEDYKHIQKGTSLEQRKQLAAKAFKHLSQYDATIYGTLNKKESFSIKAEHFKTLRYGENPHQKAHWHSCSLQGLHRAEILQGKELSFNNLLDLQTAISLLRDLAMPTVVAVKHNSPCGIASQRSIFQALEKAVSADPISVFGSIIGFNRKVTENCARKLKKLFVECVIAPDFSKEALALMRGKKNTRLLQWPDMLSFPTQKEKDFKPVDGGLLVQDREKTIIPVWSKKWKVIGKNPDKKTKEDLIFAWIASAHLKSNSIAIVKNRQTLGLGMGQVNRVDSVRLALARAKQFHPKENHFLVLASDGFFPFPDSIELMSQTGIQWVIQPGGSLRDREVIEKAKKLKITMVLTGKRHFKH